MNPYLQRIAALLERLVAAQQKGFWDYASIIAVVATLGVLIWYTIETYHLRKSAQIQTEAATMPIVMFDILLCPLSNGVTLRPTLRNMGFGPAFDVTIASLTAGSLTMEFTSVPVLSAGQDEIVRVTLKRDGQKERELSTMFNLQQLLPEGASGATTITYRSVTGLPYRTHFSVGRQEDEKSCLRFERMERLKPRKFHS